MKKKLLSLLLATVMIMGLAACGTAGNTDNSVSGNAEAAQTEWNTDNTIVYGSNDLSASIRPWMSMEKSMH